PQLELGFSPAPVHLVREMIDVSRRLIAGNSVTNPTYHMSEARARHNTPSELPIYVACSGPKMLQMAGAYADGVIMMSGATTDTSEFALSRVRSGAAQAGRSDPAIDIAWGAATVIDDDPREARNQTRLMAAWFANHSVRYTQKVGAAPELVSAMRRQ